MTSRAIAITAMMVVVTITAASSNGLSRGVPRQSSSAGSTSKTRNTGNGMKRMVKALQRPGDLPLRTAMIRADQMFSAIMTMPRIMFIGIAWLKGAPKLTPRRPYCRV